MSGYDSSSGFSSRSNSGGSSDSGSGGDNFPVFHRRRKGADGSNTRAGNTAYSVSPTIFDPICAVCQKPVLDEKTSVRTLEGSILHKECFCCSTCGKPLEIKNNDAAYSIDEIIEGGNVPTYGTDLNGKYFCNEHLRSSKPSSIEYKELKSGYLYKQGRVVKNWKRRFFVLLSDLKQLRYYQKDSDDFTHRDDSSVMMSSSSSSSSITFSMSQLTSSLNGTRSTSSFSNMKEDSQQQQNNNINNNNNNNGNTPLFPSMSQKSTPITIKQSKATSLGSSPGGSESSSYDSPTGSPVGYQFRRGIIQSSPRKTQKTTKNKGFIDLCDVTGIVPASFSLRGVAGCPDGSCPGFQLLTKDRVWNLVCLDESERGLWINAIKYVASLPASQPSGKRKRILTQIFG